MSADHIHSLCRIIEAVVGKKWELKSYNEEGYTEMR